MQPRQTQPFVGITDAVTTHTAMAKVAAKARRSHPAITVADSRPEVFDAVIISGKSAFRTARTNRARPDRPVRVLDSGAGTRAGPGEEGREVAMKHCGDGGMEHAGTGVVVGLRAMEEASER
jgi:hypothetical protein